MLSVKDILKRQLAMRKPQPKVNVRSTAPVPVMPKMPTRREAIMAFMEDRNYTGKPSSDLSYCGIGQVRRIIEREQSSEYMPSDNNARHVNIKNASMSDIELDMNNYRQPGKNDKL